MTKTANSLAGYIALLRQLAVLCKVGSAIATAIARYKNNFLTFFTFFSFQELSNFCELDSETLTSGTRERVG